MQSRRQLVTRERPFSPRVLYVTSTLLTLLELAWGAVVVALAWAHRGRLAALKQRIAERLTRRPPLPAAPRPTTEIPPF